MQNAAERRRPDSHENAPPLDVSLPDIVGIVSSDDQMHEVVSDLRETILYHATTEPSQVVTPPTLPKVQLSDVGPGEAALFSMKSPVRESANQDSLGAFSVNDDRGLLVVADGVGGHRGGRRASQSLVRAIEKTADAIRKSIDRPPVLISKTIPVDVNPSSIDTRGQILEQLDRVNRRLLKRGSGAATTLAMVEIQGNKARTYHVGDSEILIVSQRGRIKYRTVAHSPVGYAHEAGMLTEEEALVHSERHLISNIVGCDHMSIECGPWIKLSARDTVLIGSDGLFDNLKQSEIVDLIRVGRLEESVQALAEKAVNRMVQPAYGLPSKNDDLTMVVYRRSRPRSKRTTA